MLSFQGMRMRTARMMEIIHYQAVEETYQKWKAAVRNYYEHGYDYGETTKLYKELESLSVDMEKLFEEDLKIRDEVTAQKEE